MCRTRLSPPPPPPSRHPLQARARDPARLGLGSPTRALQPRRWCIGRQPSPTRQQEAKAVALLQGEVPSWTEIAGSRDPVLSLSSALKPDCRIPQLRSLASNPAHRPLPYLASPTAPRGPEGCLPGVLRTARGGAGPRLQAAGWQEASSASAGGEAAAPPSGPLSYPRSSSGVLVALLL